MAEEGSRIERSYLVARRSSGVAPGAWDPVTIVDTTVWIDFFRGADTPEVRELQRLIDASEDVCICGVILTEVLQGIREDKDHAVVAAAFDAFLFLPMTQRTFIRAADLYRTLRRKGVTIRNAADCMIASVATEHDIPLLHNDRDFDAIASLGELKVVKTRERPRRSTVRFRRP
jgi:predicted nucleic acid-binding protein